MAIRIVGSTVTEIEEPALLGELRPREPPVDDRSHRRPDGVGEQGKEVTEDPECGDQLRLTLLRLLDTPTGHADVR